MALNNAQARNIHRYCVMASKARSQFGDYAVPASVLSASAFDQPCDQQLFKIVASSSPNFSRSVGSNSLRT